MNWTIGLEHGWTAVITFMPAFIAFLVVLFVGHFVAIGAAESCLCVNSGEGVGTYGARSAAHAGAATKPVCFFAKRRVWGA